MFTKEQIEEAFKRKRGDVVIKTLPEIIQSELKWSGAYNLMNGEIELGSTEKNTIHVLIHEILHKVLFETVDLESGYAWDKISNRVLGTIEDIPFVYTLPAKKAEKHRFMGGLYSFQEKHRKKYESSVKPVKSSKVKIPVKNYKTIHAKLLERLLWKIKQ